MSELHRILYIEDSVADALIMRECFAQAGVACDVQVAEDGIKGLAILRREGMDPPARPDLVLLDLNLPRKSGAEVLQEIRASNELQHLPVIVVTTSKAEEDVRRAYRLGANCFITKPGDIDGSLEMVRAIAAFWLGTATLPRP
jgi:two-component system, chemotaxis family, response regulator Rcp1